MEIDDIKGLWQLNNLRLEKTVGINLSTINKIQSQKVKSNISPLLVQRIIENIFHSAAIILLLLFIRVYYQQTPYAVSAIVLLCFYVMLFLNSIRQIKIIRSIYPDQKIVSIQSKLATLQTHSLNFMRLILLFLPAVLAYPMVVSRVIQDYDLSYLSFMDIQAKSTINWWQVQLIGTLVGLPFCIWLYGKISYKNIHIPWVKNFMTLAIGKKTTKAATFLNELTSLQKD